MTSDSLDDGSNVLQQYLQAFASDTSTLVVAPARVAAAAAEPGFAGWTVTDCSKQFVDVAGGGIASTTDELVFESSGTTGDPKLVCYRKQVIRECALAIADRLGLQADRDYVTLVNPRFAYGLSVIHSHHLASVPLRVEAAPTSLGAWARFRQSLRPGTRLYLSPHQSVLLGQDPDWRFDAPIELIFAGSALRLSMVAPLRRCFPNAIVTNMYGQSELGPRIAIASTAIAEFREGDVGRPLPGVRVRTTSATGDLSVSTPFRMEFYVTVTGEPITDHASDEWWPTGDIGGVDDDGRVLITDRAAPDINFLGARIVLDHLRQTVRAVDRVIDVKVTAVPHQTFGQCPHIRVLIATLADADVAERAVRIALSNTIGKAAAAAIVELVDPASLPESGKL